MTRPPTDVVLEHYGRRYIERFGRLPRKRCFGALQRLIGTGHVMPNRGTPHEQELTRKLCAAMFRERPRLRLVRPGDEI